MTSNANYGASPEDWAHFDLVLGLGPDLLPVVSNPTAPISPDSKMKALGKTPSRYNRSRQAVGIAGWTDHKATPEDLERWAKEPDYGICIQTREVRALDIDVEDGNLANAIRAEFEIAAGLGLLPLRYREGTGKRLLCFRTPGEISKRSFKCAGGLVELLATGQQFIAIGTHTGGERYQWADGIPADIPVLSSQQLDVAWARIVEEFATEAPSEQSSKTKSQALADAVDADPVAAALRQRDLILSTERDGRLHIECPFADEHTTEGAESATSYFPAHTGGYARGHFHCMHAHCAERSDNDFLSALGLAHDPRDDFTAEDTAAAVEIAREANARKKFVLQTAAEFKDGTPIRWFIKGVIPSTELVVVYGPPGSGKSFWTTDVGLAVSRGLGEWRGHKVRKARVCYVAAEGAPGFRNRLTAYCTEHQIPIEELPIFIIPATPNLMQRDDVVALGNAIIEAGKVDLLIVDTLARATTGADENSAKDMGVVIDHCRVLHEVTGATVLLVHHSGKDPSKGARGSNAILGAADAEIEISRDGERRLATVSKMKDGTDGLRLGFRLKNIVIGMDEDGDTVESCVVEQTDAPIIGKRERKMGNNEHRIWQSVLELQKPGEKGPGVEAVISHAVDQTPFDSASGKRDQRRNHMGRALDNLIVEGKLRIEGGAIVVVGEEG